MAGLNWLIAQLRRAMGRDGASDGMTLDRAMGYPPVWHAVSKISGHIAYLPTNLHRESKSKSGMRVNEKVLGHIGYRLMRVRPNGYQTPMAFKRQLMVHSLMLGNGFAYISRDGMNTELLPLMPDRMEVKIVGGEKVYFYKPDKDERLATSEDIQRGMEESRRSGRFEVIPLMDTEVLHIPGLSYDGISGYSLLSLASKAFELGVGAENVERSRQRKGYAGGLMLEAPDGSFSKQKDAEEFLEWFRNKHDGEDNVGKTGLLTRGIKANVLQMSASDSQFIEQRRFQRQDAALLFMLEHILGDDSSVSYNSLEQKNLAYLQNCLAPWLKTWEEELELKLLTERERQGGYYFKFNDGALLRTDKQTTSTIIATLRASQVISANEARELLDMNPYDGGDSYENPNTTSAKPSGAAASQSEGTANAVAAKSRQLSIAESIQKIYLGVNKVVTSDEARQIVNEESGSSLAVPGPEFASQPAFSSDTQRASALVRNRISQLLRTEANQAIAACSAANFVDKIEKLYAKWQKTWANDIGVEAATAHCESAKAELLAIAGQATTTEELRGMVELAVKGWDLKVDELESELLQC